MGVVVEESEELVLELWEFLLAWESLIVLHIVVHQVDGFGFEKLADFRVVMDDISQMELVEAGVGGLVSDSGPEEHPGQDGEALEAEGQIPELVEEDGEGGQDKDLEVVLEPLATVVDLLEGGEHSEEDVLPVGVEGRTDGGRILGLADMGRREIVLEVGEIGGLPLVLPPDVVGVACSPTDFVISQSLLQKLSRSTS